MIFGTDLSDKVAVVTGAGGVICGMYALTLARAGAKVALLDRNLESAEKIADNICKEGGIAKAYQVDVLDRNSLNTAHEQILKDFIGAILPECKSLEPKFSKLIDDNFWNLI